MTNLIPAKPANATWTDVQWRAICASGQDILVSAAAGSGKTAVLINRMIRKVLDRENPIDVDELLVVTFTNASAAEMRQRMAEALEAALKEDPTSVHLRRQLTLINKAQISTLHSFCLAIVKQYAYLIDVDPGFRIANEGEAALLRDDVLAAVLEAAYKDDNAENIQALYRLVDSFTSDRDDSAIETLIAELYDMSRVHADPHLWLHSLVQLYEVPADELIDDLSFMPVIRQSIARNIEAAMAVNDEIRELALQPAGPAAYADNYELNTEVLRTGSVLAKQGTWQELYDYFTNLKWARLKPIRKDDLVDDDLKEQAQKKNKTLKTVMDTIKDNYFTRSPQRLLEEMRVMAPLMKTLVQLTEKFATRYHQTKVDKGIVDFSDLEHYALQILTTRDEGVLVPSDVAKDYRKHFKEVLVDEYQDTNLLQETILQLVKQGDEASGNLFMVGDVKQSIYRFRLAEPKLFLRKYQTFEEEPEHTGMRIDLNANFRSRKEVLHATNFVFSQLMDEEVGEVAYDDKASLKVGANYNDEAIPVEVAIIDNTEQDDDEEAEVIEASKEQLEARFIAQRIQQLMQAQTKIFDTKHQVARDLQYRDIVILTRSMSWANDIVEECKTAGIPLYAETSTGYFDAVEVLIMLNTLKIIDNPYQDIPLASVLRAPFVGLTENELAAIRLANQKVPFYDALQQFKDSEASGLAPHTAEKLQRFLQQYENWRDLAHRGSLAELIWQIYNDTNYYEMVGAMANGKQRQANLRALHDRALMYEKTSFRGLFRFLRFIDRIRLRGDDLASAKSISAQENVVRLVTIHSSKGLEFPVVFVAGLGRQFNKQDFNRKYLFDQDYGLAVKAIDPDIRVYYESLPFLALKEKKQLEMRAEEMRVLYVAMTRAKERLILCATTKKLETLTTKWAMLSTQKAPLLPAYLRADANSYLDWLGAVLARHECFDTLVEGTVPMPNNANITLAVVRPEQLAIEAYERVQESAEESADYAQLEGVLEERFNYKYPHQAAVNKRTKTSVSEQKKLLQLQQQSEPELFATAQVQTSIAERPQFMQQQDMSAMELGTAVHSVMQHVPKTGFDSVQEVQAFIATLYSKQIITKAEQQAVEPQMIYNFFETEMGELFKYAQDIRRELPFTLRVVDDADDAQILQGIIDCLLQDRNGDWYIIDYKTDRVGHLQDEALLGELEKRYALQLQLYKQAVEEILHITIKAKYIYLMRDAKTVIMP